MMGRPAQNGKLTERPSDVFRKHFVVAPYPEEGLARVLDILPRPQQGAFTKEDGEPVVDAEGNRVA